MAPTRMTRSGSRACFNAEERVLIEVFTAPGCPHCAGAHARVSAAVEAIGLERFELRAVDVVEEIDHAVELGVLSTPTIAIDGKRIFSGLPLSAELERMLKVYSSSPRSQR